MNAADRRATWRGLGADDWVLVPFGHETSCFTSANAGSADLPLELDADTMTFRQQDQHPVGEDS